MNNTEYVFKAFAREVQRYLKQKIIGKIFVEPLPDDNKIRISILMPITDEEYEVFVENIQEAIEKDGARDIAINTQRSYRDYVWHLYFKERIHKVNSENSEA